MTSREAILREAAAGAPPLNDAERDERASMAGPVWGGESCQGAIVNPRQKYGFGLQEGRSRMDAPRAKPDASERSVARATSTREEPGEANIVSMTLLGCPGLITRLGSAIKASQKAKREPWSVGGAAWGACA